MFAFKQFTVRQERAAMKVTTDACVQGAWWKLPERASTLLDVGAGTGLLSLMMAQRHPELRITAVELDADAAGQAAENVSESPFAARIGIVHQDVAQHAPDHRYDHLICNPPFFSNSLRAPDAQRSRARHDDHLPLRTLVEQMERLLASEGTACVLLPASRLDEWEGLLLEAGWRTERMLSVRSYADQPAGRVIVVCGRNAAAEAVQEELVIYQAQRVYTDAFTALLAPYYAYL